MIDLPKMSMSGSEVKCPYCKKRVELEAWAFNEETLSSVVRLKVKKVDES